VLRKPAKIFLYSSQAHIQWKDVVGKHRTMLLYFVTAIVIPVTALYPEDKGLKKGGNASSSITTVTASSALAG